MIPRLGVSLVVFRFSGVIVVETPNVTFGAIVRGQSEGSYYSNEVSWRAGANCRLWLFRSILIDPDIYRSSREPTYTSTNLLRRQFGHLHLLCPQPFTLSFHLARPLHVRQHHKNHARGRLHFGVHAGGPLPGWREH